MKGFSLIEAMVAMSIALIVGLLLLVVIVNSSGLFYTQSSKVEGGLSANEALFQIRSNIKDSSGVVASYTDGAVTYTTDADLLVLKIPSVDSSDNIIPDGYDYFVYFLDQTTLRLKTFPAANSSREPQDRIFSTTVDGLVFKYFNSANPPVEVTPQTASEVQITLVLKQKAGAGFEVNIATSEANLRND